MSCVPQKKKFFILDNKSFFFTKLVWSGALDISQVSISFRVYGPRGSSRLGNNPCVLERREAGSILLVTKRPTIDSNEESQLPLCFLTIVIVHKELIRTRED